MNGNKPIIAFLLFFLFVGFFIIPLNYRKLLQRQSTSERLPYEGRIFRDIFFTDLKGERYSIFHFKEEILVLGILDAESLKKDQLSQITSLAKLGEKMLLFLPQTFSKKQKQIAKNLQSSSPHLSLLYSEKNSLKTLFSEKTRRELEKKKFALLDKNFHIRYYFNPSSTALSQMQKNIFSLRNEN